MKKLLLLICLLMPLLAAAQNTQDADFCISRTTTAPFTAQSNHTYRALSVTGTITIPDGATNIHIVKCSVGSSTNSRGAINIGHNTSNIVIDTCYIHDAYYGVNMGGGNTQSTGNGNKVNYNRFYNIQDAPGHPHGGGCAVQLNMITGSGIQINYNDCYFPGLGPDVGDILSIYKSFGTASSPIQVDHNCIEGGSSDPTGKGAIILGDVGGAYQEALYNTSKNPGYVGVQIQGGSHLNMSYNVNYSAKNSISLLGMSYANYASDPFGNNTMGHNRNNWTNFRGNIDNGTYKAAAGKPIDWDTNTPEFVADPTVNSGVLPDPLFNPGCNVVVVPPKISYTTPNTYTVGQSVSLAVTNTGGAATSYSTTGLPSGLSLNTSTGLISGTVNKVTPTASYSVSATNTGGTGNTGLTITVNSVPLPVPHITYTTPQTYQLGAPITPLSPISTGGSVSSYSGSLPSGLSLNTSNGVITGAPAVVGSGSYPITGTNASGNSIAPLSISVINPTPSAPVITYSPSSQTGMYGYTITVMTPANTGGVATTWSVSPALPAGLNFANGVISGVPAIVQTATTYTVTAQNGGGESHTTVSITINKAPLTISAISTSKMQGAPNPNFLTAYSGLVNGNTGISTSPTISTTAVTNSPIGTYPIVLSGGASNFYTITLVDGILSVFGAAQGLNIHFGGIVPTP